METRKLGTSDLDVTLVGLGCNNFGMRCDAEQTRAVVHKALDLGITLFDTSDIYGGRGTSEQLLGKALGSKRKDIVLATKFSGPMGDSPLDRGASRRYVWKAVDASLQRLGTDYIDLYQQHFPDPATPIEETLDALDALVKQGKVRYIGTSQTKGWQFVDMQWTARTNGLAPVTTCMAEYSLLASRARARVDSGDARAWRRVPPVLSSCERISNRQVQARSSAAGRRADHQGPALFGQVADGRTLETRSEQLEAFCNARGRTMVELAFSWLAAQPVISSIIAGATKPEQLAVNIKAADWKLTPEELAEIDTITGHP